MIEGFQAAKSKLRTKGGENKMKKTIIGLFFVVTILMMATSAMATPITGEINFVGNLILLGGTSLNTATGIDFKVPSYVIETTSGVYDAIPDLTHATFQDFSFAALPVVPLWTLTYNGVTYDFDLSSITAITATEITGTGTLGATGFEDTVGTWVLTTQTGSGVMSFSSSSTAVPEPRTLLMLGSGLASLAFFARRRRN